ncbi:hypothetical protein [Pseudaminobacter sp. NGMCC 1.201702]|uniref:hypothetical protein n=1 Tax=Pseudaminobacter sp. NGMCC 1.201702 TaxID=3391825 RepID=UPI0039F0BF8E
MVKRLKLKWLISSGFAITVAIAVASFVANSTNLQTQVITAPGALPEGISAWTVQTGLEIGGRKAVATNGWTPEATLQGSEVSVQSPLGLFQRNWRSLLRFHLAGADDGLFPVEPDGEYAIDVLLGGGRSHVELFFAEYSEDRELLSVVPLSSWEMQGAPREFGMRFKVSPFTRWIEPRIVVDGTFSMRVESLTLTAIDGIHQVRMN